MVCRDTATRAVREHVHRTASDADASVDDIELTIGHFERALEDVQEIVGQFEDASDLHPEAV